MKEYNWDISEKIILQLQHLEQYEVDELIFPLAIIIIGVFIDLLRKTRECCQGKEMEAQKLKTLKATMHNVNDLVNNFLNNLQYYHLLLKDNGLLTSKEQKEILELIHKTSTNLEKIGNVEKIVFTADNFPHIEVDIKKEINKVKDNQDQSDQIQATNRIA